MQNLNIEEKMIKSCIIKNKRPRYLGFIDSKKKRSKFTNQLYHFSNELDGFSEIIKDEILIIDKQIQSLKQNSNCYVISASPELDQLNISTNDALKMIENGNCDGSIFIFGNVELVLYIGEDIEGRWIKRFNL